MKKAVVIVLDGVGIGNAPDAKFYNDEGSNTLGNIAKALNGIELPNLEKLGLGKIVKLNSIEREVIGCFGKMKEVSRGKDSTTGHWELGGLISEKQFPVYPNGFPDEIIEKFIRLNNLKGILGNKAASGTEIIKELGEEHIKTGYPIVYTSADSVFQIAAHEDVIPVERLYEICKVTREQVMIGEHAVGRIIARPFIGANGNFTRTYRRKDFALEPNGDVIFDVLKRNNIKTIGIGKINDLYAYRNIDVQIKTKNNLDGILQTIDAIKSETNSYIMTNLVDFDMLYGHRNDVQGFYNALLEFDNYLPEIMNSLNEEDLLFITADHGNDPTFPGTDHTRELVPILVYGKKIKQNVNLGLRETFADLAKTICHFYGFENNLNGKSFLTEIIL
ncbi:MAG: phosphopentomutase [Ignavibacteria bacterium]|jgi:phosphopentomutase|nr:phosphopentomutase [Ignavibacteria bacterium]MDH7528031.1 phosphopentomutase [Ignavibacteria bacterium]